MRNGQYQSLTTAIQTFQSIQSVVDRAKQYQQLFLSKTHGKEDEQLIAMIAVFLAESQELVYDLTGARRSKIGLLCNRLFSRIGDTRAAVLSIQRFLKWANLQTDTRVEIESAVGKIMTNLLEMQDFQHKMDTLSLPHDKSFSRFAWMLYIDSREHILPNRHNDREQTNYLMASVFYFMIRYSNQPLLQHESHLSKRQSIAKTMDQVLQAFKIHDIDQYKTIANSFDQYIQFLLNQHVLCTSQCDSDFLEHSVIDLNFRRLSNKYQKSLNEQMIDYRVFRHEKMVITPVKKQALARQFTKRVSEVDYSGFQSHRILNFDISLSDEKMNNQPIFNDGREIHGIRALAQSIRLRNQLNQQILNLLSAMQVQSRPLTIYLQQSPQYQQSIRHIKSHIMSHHRHFKTNQLCMLSTSIYELLTASFDHRTDYQQWDNINLHNSLIAVSLTMMDLLIQSVESKEILNHHLMRVSTSAVMQIWAVLEFMQTHYDLPQKLEQNVSAAKKQIVRETLWKDERMIREIQAVCTCRWQLSMENQILCSIIQCLFEEIQTFLVKMGSQIELSGQACDHSYTCTKYILTHNPQLLSNRHLFQILMCSLYISAKINALDVKFLQIKQSYEKIYCSHNILRVFCGISISPHQQGDIVQFYNQVFIAAARPLVSDIAHPRFENMHPILQSRICSEQPISPIEQEDVEMEAENSEDVPVLVNMLNTLDTQKPYARDKAKVQQQYKPIKEIGIDILNSERNATRVRIRPEPSHNSCETEKSRNY